MQRDVGPGHVTDRLLQQIELMKVAVFRRLFYDQLCYKRDSDKNV